MTDMARMCHKEEALEDRSSEASRDSADPTSLSAMPIKYSESFSEEEILSNLSSMKTMISCMEDSVTLVRCQG